MLRVDARCSDDLAAAHNRMAHPVLKKNKTVIAFLKKTLAKFVFLGGKTRPVSSLSVIGQIGLQDPFRGCSPGVYSATPDDLTFRHLASTYARSHRTMSRNVRWGAGRRNKELRKV